MLHRLTDSQERASAWRQGFATLASTVVDERRQVPLEGLNPDALLRSINTAIAEGYLNTLDWLSAPAAAAALYQIASALPPGDTKREIGRLVAMRLHDGDTETFISLATQLARESQRALSDETSRARITLALDQPLHATTGADALALALLCRRDLLRQWLQAPSVGSLHARRSAARLLERAAWEAVTLASGDDDSGVRVFCTEPVRLVWQRLLADRESLVWRHVATARGLLASAMPTLDDEIERHLGADFTVTEWRRAATSLAATVAHRGDESAKRCEQILESTIFAQDSGVAVAMTYGLGRAAQTEPDCAIKLLRALVKKGGLSALEALVDLSRETEPAFVAPVLEDARAALDGAQTDNDGVRAVRFWLGEQFGPNRRPTIRDLVDQGASASAIIDAVERQISTLERSSIEASEIGPVFAALRDLDRGLFENDAVPRLISLASAQQQSTRLGDAFQRITNWLVIQEGNPVVDTALVRDTSLPLRRLQALLHLVDSDGPSVDRRVALVRQRRLLTARVLLGRVEHDASAELRRALCAAAARVCDALVREELAAISDILVAVANHASNERDVSAMAEASMVPDVERALSAYAQFFAAALGIHKGRRVSPAMLRLEALANDLPAATSPRVEALRSAILRTHKALRAIERATSLSEIADNEDGAPLHYLDEALTTLMQLITGASRRLGRRGEPGALDVGIDIRRVGIEIERALRSSVSEIDQAVLTACESMRTHLPEAFSELVCVCLQRLRSLPIEAPRRGYVSIAPRVERAARLPRWIPASRLLGGFYVVRPIGTGAVGSVFIARRADDRDNASAPHFALKVPEYSGVAARTLSEQEFLQMFREEAGALLALPEHPSLAKFVTFDAGARPKPILVMELVKGPSLERMIETQELTTASALDLLLSTAAGLDAMHRAGVGHLDVKPSNIIVRAGGQPVLVDFGLAGTKLRPGCGTAYYAAPEIWGSAKTKNPPAAADVYAFACLTYETLTGQTLFDAETEVALIASHLQHDGEPELVRALRANPATQELGELLRRSLRGAPDERISMRQVRQMLANIKGDLAGRPWPLV